MSGQVWNYSFTVPCALLLVILLVFYFSRKRLPVRMNRSFIALLVFQTLVMVFDVSSSMADERYQLVSPELLYVLNTLYFMLFLGRIYCFFFFTAEVLGIRNKFYRVLAAVPIIIGELLAATSFVTGAIFWIDNGYHSGPLYNTLYVCFYFYIALSLVLAFVRMKQLKTAEFASIVAFNIVLLIGNVVRYLFPYLLAMNTFCMAAIVIIYLAFMNPDLYLTADHAAFNTRGFRAVLADWARRRDFQVLGFVIRNYNYERAALGGKQMDQVVSEVVKYLSLTFPNAYVFYLRNGRFALLNREALDWKAQLREIEQRFQLPWNVDGNKLTFGVEFAHATSDVGSDNFGQIAESIIIALDEAGSVAAGIEQHDAAGADGVQMVNQRIDVMRHLERALSEKRVEVFLQPLFDSREKKMVAAEALSRIRDDEGKIISPELFIPIAERSGYIGLLGDQVLDSVCAFIKTHDTKAMGLQWINVNLSPVQCMQHDLPKRFQAMLDSWEVDSSMIHLEITEESMVDNAVLERQMLQLKEMGFQFALDDYGSGYSNLTRVKRYPFANVKIDREVVWDYCRELDSLLPNIVKSFHETGYTVTAEGVETEEMANCLTEIGCDYLQGFYYSKPLPMEDFATFATPAPRKA